MSKTLANFATYLVKGLTSFQRPYRRANTRALVAEGLEQSVTVTAGGRQLHFATPSARALHDPWNFHTNEPETVTWLDTLGPADVLWDIGANIGVYSVYAAKVRGASVVAFEPAAATFAALARSISLNGLDRQVDPYCLALADETRAGRLHLRGAGAGHSQHGLDAPASGMGAFDAVAEQAIPVFTVDQISDLLALPKPTHIKLDVDGPELAVLAGAQRTLADTVKSVLVEIEETPQSGSATGIADTLNAYGFDTDGAKGHRNQVFRRRTN